MRLLGWIIASVWEHLGLVLGTALVVGFATFVMDMFSRNLRMLHEAHLTTQPPAHLRADVGGTPSAWERPAAGYVRIVGAGGRPIPRLSCGLVLIAPRVAVTAAHCVAQRERYVVGFGPAPRQDEAEACRGSEVEVRGIRVREGWDRTSARDLALLFLDEPPTSIPLARLAPSTGALLTSGGPGVELESFVYGNALESNERRRVAMRATRRESAIAGPEQVHAEGLGAGICWGDSGSGVWDPESGAVVGLLNANHAEPTTYRCRMLTQDVWADCRAFRCAADRPFEFLDLTVHREWIAAEIQAYSWAPPLVAQAGRRR